MVRKDKIAGVAKTMWHSLTIQTHIFNHSDSTENDKITTARGSLSYPSDFSVLTDILRS